MVVCVVVSLAPNRLKALPHNCASGHQIAKAQVGGLRGLGLGGGAMPESRCQRCAHPDLGYGQPDDGQTEHAGPDSEDAASTGVCFHGPTLSCAAPGVLIEKNHSVIDGSDESYIVAGVLVELWVQAQFWRVATFNPAAQAQPKAVTN